MEYLKNLLKPSIRGGLVGLTTTALSLTLGYPSIATAQISKNSKAKIAEAINPSNDVDTVNAIDFDTARKSIKKSDENTESVSDFEEYINKYIQYFDSLSIDEKKSIIRDITKEDSEVKKVINDMINDESIIKALKMGDIKSIEKIFVDKMDHSVKNLVLGAVISFCIWVLLRTRKNGFDKIKYVVKTELSVLITASILLGIAIHWEEKDMKKSERIEKAEQLQKQDTTNVIDFYATKINFDDIANSDFRSKFEKNRDKAFKLYDSLSDEKKISLIYGILENNEKIKKVISDMIKDKDIIEAIKYGDNKTMEKAFERKMMGESLLDCILAMFVLTLVVHGMIEIL